MKTKYYISQDGTSSYALRKTLRIRKKLKNDRVKEVAISSNVNDVVNYMNGRKAFLPCTYIEFLLVESKPTNALSTICQRK